MKAGIIFTGSGPEVIITSFDSFTNPNLLEKLSSKGIKKFIVFEVPLEKVIEKYGSHYSIVMNDLKQQDDIRVLDYDGRHIFSKFSFSEMESPVFYEHEGELV